MIAAWEVSMKATSIRLYRIVRATFERSEYC